MPGGGRKGAAEGTEVFARGGVVAWYVGAVLVLGAHLRWGGQKPVRKPQGYAYDNVKKKRLPPGAGDPPRPRVLARQTLVH